MAYMRLGGLLVSSGVITEAQLEQALSVPKEDGQRLGDVLIQHGFITEAQLIDALRVQLGVDFVDLTAVSLPVELAQYVPRTIAKKYDVVPVKLVQDRLYLAMQDPDIISVGEIRDGETASIAMRSAITGHLVFSTLHTNDAVSAVSRLKDIGVEPWLVSAALRGVVSQRLVRKICPHCKTAYRPSDEELVCWDCRRVRTQRSARARAVPSTGTPATSAGGPCLRY